VNKYPSVTFRIETDLLEAIDVIADSRRISRSRFIIDALESHIDAYIEEGLNK
jgi:predicted transcriptional regulator